MSANTSKLNPQWVRQARQYFQEFLEVTQFPEPVRNGTRGSAFTYPEWLIMFIAVLAVKCKQKNYQAIHRMVLQYWEILTEGLELKQPISESQLRDRLKKIGQGPGSPAAFIFQVFPEESLTEAGECGQDDAQSQRAGLAQEAEGEGGNPPGVTRAGSGGDLGEIRLRGLGVWAWEFLLNLPYGAGGGGVSVDAQFGS